MKYEKKTWPAKIPPVFIGISLIYTLMKKCFFTLKLKNK